MKVYSTQRETNLSTKSYGALPGLTPNNKFQENIGPLGKGAVYPPLVQPEPLSPYKFSSKNPDKSKSFGIDYVKDGENDSTSLDGEAVNNETIVIKAVFNSENSANNALWALGGIQAAGLKNVEIASSATIEFDKDLDYKKVNMDMFMSNAINNTPKIADHRMPEVYSGPSSKFYFGSSNMTKTEAFIADNFTNHAKIMKRDDLTKKNNMKKNMSLGNIRTQLLEDKLGKYCANGDRTNMTLPADDSTLINNKAIRCVGEDVSLKYKAQN